MYMFIYIAILLICIYIGSLIYYILGNIVKSDIYKSHHLNSVSIIIAVKNGQYSLPNILSDLEKQNYNGESEYIIVDDESIDRTEEIIKEYSKKNDKFIYASSIDGNQNLFFKKRAIDAGIKKAKYDILIFTDVDCRVPNTWVQSMASCFQNQVDYVVGVSKISKPINIISRFQKIDLLMMMIAGRAGCNLEDPIASTGQNQAYKKYLYHQNNGFIKIQDSIQGDDSLFMHLCLKKNAKIKFNSNTESFVESRLETNFSSFIKQRIRWAADAKVMWRYNKKIFILLLSTFSINLIFLLSPLISFFIELQLLKMIYIAFIMKLILEFIIYIIGSIKLKNKINVLNFIAWYFLNIPYVVVAGLGSFFIKHIKWRGQIDLK